MISNDLKDLLTKFHTDKYRIVRVKIDLQRDSSDGDLTEKVTITLKKDDKLLNLESTEIDFCSYAVQLRGVTDNDGNCELMPIKDTQQYWQDLEFLADKDHSNINEALNDITQGKFRLTSNDLQSTANLIQDFLERRNNIKDKSFIRLKKEHYHILAATLMFSKWVLAEQNQLESREPNIKPTIYKLDRLLLPFRKQGNPIKNFKHYRKYVTFDIAAWGENLHTQLGSIIEVLESLKKQNTPLDSGILKLASIYHNYIELSQGALNLLRVGLEMSRGNLSPVKKLPVGKNMEILKNDTEYGQIFICLDPQIRHGHAHCSVDFKDDMVRIRDLRNQKVKIIKTYTPEQFVSMVDTMRNNLFPAMIFMIFLHDLAMLDMLLCSKEYRLRLAAIGNC